MIPHMMDQFRQSLNGPGTPDDATQQVTELRQGVPTVSEDRREYIGEPDWDAAERKLQQAANTIEALLAALSGCVSAWDRLYPEFPVGAQFEDAEFDEFYRARALLKGGAA